MIGRIAALAVNTAREAIRNKLLYTLLFFAIAMMIFGTILSALSYVDRQRMMQDFAFASIRLFSVAIAVFVGVGLIHKEVERRTVYTILSKPLSRAEFLLGKYTGLILIIWLQVAVMAAFFAGVSLLIGAPLGLTHLAALALTGVELALAWREKSPARRHAVRKLLGARRVLRVTDERVIARVERADEHGVGTGALEDLGLRIGDRLDGIGGEFELDALGLHQGDILLDQAGFRFGEDTAEIVAGERAQLDADRQTAL